MLMVEWDNGRGLNSILSHILDNGVFQSNSRTGQNTLSCLGVTVVVGEGDFPFTTNLLASPRLAFEEVMLFLRGSPNTKLLEEKGVNFWRGNTSREFLDSRGLTFPEGSLGRAYSAQWRDFGGVSGIGCDQLKVLLDGIKEDPEGRRHIVSLWNPVESHLMPLLPCWFMSQYVVMDGKLSVILTNRSCDTTFGMRYALQNYALFQRMLCRMFGFEVGEIIANIGHAHIYENQLGYVEELLTRDFPELHSNIRLKDNVVISDLHSLLNIEWSDWEMEYNYNKTPFVTKRPEMVV